jgi:hypothetical protein
VTHGHNTYARDGISVMRAPDLGKYIGRELLLLTMSTLLQLPRFMDVRLDRKAFLNAFYITDEEGVRHQLEDWELGPGHAPGGVDHPTPAGVQETNPAPHYNNYSRAQKIAEWAAHEQAHERTLPLAVVARSGTAEGEVSNFPMLLASQCLVASPFYYCYYFILVLTLHLQR